ncbi:CHAT domain-containing tetratricopeptide repeat protein [Fibrella musci]|uniref:CHAT domain-containing tetratricopeptide repeat protein n=1 Tax=Fibrella musci TaxID=3242485 RepID=UPI00352186F6
MRKAQIVIVVNGWLLCFLGKTGTWAQSADALWRQANAAYTEQPQQALGLFQQAEQLAIAQRRFDLAANIFVDEATLHYIIYNNYQQATLACQKGLALRPIADSTQFKLWASLGEMYHRRNLPDSANRSWQQADLCLARRPGIERQTPTYVAAYYGNRGTDLFEEHDYRLAAQFFQKQLRLLARAGTKLHKAVAENQFAYFYLKTGQLDRADSLFQQAVRTYPVITRPGDLNRGWFLLGLIDCRLQRQQPDSLLPLLRQTEQLARQAGEAGRELASYLALAKGRYYTLCQQPAPARTAFVQSLALARPLSNAWVLLWQNQMALSYWHNRWGTAQQALTYAQQAIQTVSVEFRAANLADNPTVQQFLNGPKLAESLYWKARLLHQTTSLPNHLSLANQTYDRALALSAHLQATYGSDITRLFIQTKLRPALEDALAVAYACYQQQPDAAQLQTLRTRQEQASAAILLAGCQREQQLPAAVRVGWQQAKARLSAAKNALANQPNASQLPQLRAELVDAELAWGRLQRQTVPAMLPVRQTTATDQVSSTTLQQQLGTQTAFLHYSLTPDSLLLTVTTKHRTQVRCLPISRTQLTRLCLRFRREVYRNPDPFQYAGQADAQALFDKLLRPVWPSLRNIERLVIVRDGPLHHLPFEVLAVTNRPDDYLIRHMAITYAYSAAGFVQARRPGATDAPLLLSMAPFTQATPPGNPFGQYSPLPGSEREAGSVGGTQSTGGNASKAQFLALNTTHQLIHLATHAEANHTNYDESFVAFYPTDANHRLYAHEIETLPLQHVRLTMLSACRSGNGPLQAGEGLLGLARAFAAAGCPQTVASLWNAHDGTTARLSTLFYEELQRGLPSDVALQRAKIRFLDSQPAGGAFTPPHFWAHLILIGQHQPVFPPASKFPVSWLLAGAVVLGIGVWWWQLKQRT